MSDPRDPGSFRDPSGFLFRREGVLLRQINEAYAPHYEQLVDSGLLAELTNRHWLVEHEETDEPAADEGAGGSSWRVIRPRELPFVSYPYEWCFGQYRDAALLTLDIQALALDHGMTLKDASAYNVQFVGSRPLLIDTLSFERYEEGRPWIAYRQFCQHFLAPLALMAYRDIRLSSLMRTQIDGIPLDLAATLLPARARLRFGLLSHLFLHARSQQRMAASRAGASSFKMSALAMKGLVSSLRNAVARLAWALPETEWGDYYEGTNYSPQAADQKGALLGDYLEAVTPATVWDMGANDGRFSRQAAEIADYTVAFDVDPVAVEKNYRTGGERNETGLLALRLDLTNPSPGIGWNHAERASLVDRGPADAVVALALIHHLAIGNNVPLSHVAGLLSRLGRRAIIEWVPKKDSQVERLLASREDVFPDYDQAGFETAIAPHFEVERREPVAGSERTLYLLRRNS